MFKYSKYHVRNLDTRASNTNNHISSSLYPQSGPIALYHSLGICDSNGVTTNMFPDKSNRLVGKERRKDKLNRYSLSKKLKKRIRERKKLVNIEKVLLDVESYFPIVIKEQKMSIRELNERLEDNRLGRQNIYFSPFSAPMSVQSQLI